MMPNLGESLNKDGIFYRNPTHLEEAERALTQSDIVKQVNQSRRGRQHELFEYTEEKESRYLPGTIKIREMVRAGEPVEENAIDPLIGYFNSFLKVRPSIYMARIRLGDYPSQQEVKNRYVTRVGSTNPRSYKDISKSIAELFRAHNIVDFAYVVESATPGKFSSRAFAFETTDPEYDNDQYFNPIVEIEYIS